MSFAAPGSYAFNASGAVAAPGRPFPERVRYGSDRNVAYGWENPGAVHGDGKPDDWELKGTGNPSALGGAPALKWERRKSEPPSGSVASAPAAPAANPLSTPKPPKLSGPGSADDAVSRSRAYLKQQGASQEAGAPFFAQANQQKQIARFDAKQIAEQFTQQALNQGAEIKYGIQKAASELPMDLKISKPLSQTDALAYARQLAELVKSA